MKWLSVLMVMLLTLLGLSSAAAAQAEPEVEVEVEGEVGAEPEAGSTVTVRTKNVDPDTEVAVALGEITGSAVADADGIAETEIVVPDSPGEIDGTVTIDGVEVPFSVLVRAAAESGAAAPTAVDAGDGLGSSGSSAFFFLAAALLLLSGGTLALRRYQSTRPV